MATVLTDADVFGTTAQPQPQGELSDADVFGAPSPDLIPTPGQRTSGQPSPVSMSGQVYSRGNVGQVAAEAWRQGLVSKDAIDEAEKTTLGHYITSPLLQISNWPIQAGNALFRGGQELVSEALSPVSPQLGRDVAAYPESRFGSVPEAPPGLPMRPDWYIRNKLAPPEAPPAPQFVQEYYGEQLPGEPPPPSPTPPVPPPPSFVPPATPPPVSLPRINELLAADQRMAQNRPAEIPPTTSVPAPGAMPGEPGEPVPIVQPPNPANRLAPQPGPIQEPLPGEPAPRAAGAAPTPGSELGLTPQQEQAYRSTAEGEKLLETQQPGIPDNTQHVPGVLANSAEIEQTVQAARELKMLKQQTPDLGQEAEQLADANNTARSEHFANLAGSPVQLKVAKEALAAQDEKQLGEVWANKQDANPQPVLDTATQILSGQDGMRPAVRNAVNSVTTELQRAGTDPELMYGVRKHIDDLLSPEGQAADPLTKRVTASLLQLKNSLTGVISDAAPGFEDYLAAHSAGMRPINAMQVLQDARPTLYGTQNRMEYGRFQRFMRDVVDERSSSPVSPYNGLNEDQMQALWGLRDDLRRSSRAVELARAQGSDSVQNLGDILRSGAKTTVSGVAGTAVGAVAGMVTHSPEVGAAVGYGTKHAIDNFFTGRAEAQRYQRGMQMLYPQNALMPQLPTLPQP